MSQEENEKRKRSIQILQKELMELQDDLKKKTRHYSKVMAEFEKESIGKSLKGNEPQVENASVEEIKLSHVDNSNGFLFEIFENNNKIEQFFYQSSCFKEVKEGFFCLENLGKISNKDTNSIKITDIPKEQFSVIMEHIRTKKLQHIGIPDELDDRLKLLEKVHNLKGLENLEKRLRILCFVDSLGVTPTEEETNQQLLYEEELFKDKAKKAKAILENLEKNISTVEEKKKEISKMNVKDQIPVVVDKKIVHQSVEVFCSGRKFVFEINEKLEEYKGTKLYSMIISANKEKKKIYLEKNSDVFERIFCLIYDHKKLIHLRNPKLESTDFLNLFLDEAKDLFHHEMIDEESWKRYKFETIGLENIRMKIEEDQLRYLFINDRKTPLLDNSFIMLEDVFTLKDNFNPKSSSREVTSLLMNEVPTILDFNKFSNTQRYLPKFRDVELPPLVNSFQNFSKNFSLFSHGLLKNLNYDNILIAGGGVLANILDFSFVEKKRQQKERMKIALCSPRSKKSKFLSQLQTNVTGAPATNSPQETPKDGNTNDILKKENEKLEVFKENEGISTKVGEDDNGLHELEMFSNTKHENLLSLPVSPSVLKRFMRVGASISATNQFHFSDNAFYNGQPIPKALQFLNQVPFEHNLFLYKKGEMRLRFVCGAEPDGIASLGFKFLPKGFYPIAISYNFDRLFFTMMNSPFLHDAPIYSIEKLTEKKESKSPLDEPVPLSIFLTYLEICEEEESYDAPTDLFFNKTDKSSMDAFEMINYFEGQTRLFGKSDVDIFLYGLTPDEAVKKIGHIFETVKRNLISQSKPENEEKEEDDEEPEREEKKKKKEEEEGEGENENEEEGEEEEEGKKKKTKKNKKKKSKQDEDQVETGKEKAEKQILLVRTNYSLTLQFWKKRPIQIILRLYKSATEILCGFDLDSSCVGYDGTRVLCMPRFRRAILNKMNLVNFERMSTTYELRLVKYAKRGFRVGIPGYIPEMVKREGLIEVAKEKELTIENPINLEKSLPIGNLFSQPNYNNTCGLDRLLFLELTTMRNVNKRVIATSPSSRTKSDYEGEGEISLIPAKLRRSVPQFVLKLIEQKVDKVKEKMKMIRKYSKKDVSGEKWKKPIIYSLNDFESIVDYPHDDAKVPSKIQFLIDNPGTQDKVTSSFQPIDSKRFNFFEGACMNFKSLVERRSKDENSSQKFSWWFGEKSENQTITNTAKPFTNGLSRMIERFKSEQISQIHSKGLSLDFNKMEVIFDKTPEKKYQLFREKDFQNKNF